MMISTSLGNQNRVVSKDKFMPSMKPQNLKLLAKRPQKSPIATAFDILAGIAVRLKISGRIPIGFFGCLSLVFGFRY